MVCDATWQEIVDTFKFEGVFLLYMFIFIKILGVVWWPEEVYFRKNSYAISSYAGVPTQTIILSMNII